MNGHSIEAARQDAVPSDGRRSGGRGRADGPLHRLLPLSGRLHRTLPPFVSYPPAPRSIRAIGAIATLLVAAGGCAVSFRELPEPVDTCVYVSPSLGDDAKGDGTRAHPDASIAQAISVAQAKILPAVCLSGEMYREQVTVVSGISIYGGFDQGDPDAPFVRSDKVTTTVSAQGFVFNAPKIDEETHLEDMTIVASSTGEPGASTYGVKLGGGQGQLFVALQPTSSWTPASTALQATTATPLVCPQRPGWGNSGAPGAPEDPAAGGGGRRRCARSLEARADMAGGRRSERRAGVGRQRQNMQSGGAAGLGQRVRDRRPAASPAGDGDGSAGSNGADGKPPAKAAPRSAASARSRTTRPRTARMARPAGDGTAGGGGGGGGGPADSACFGHLVRRAAAVAAAADAAASAATSDAAARGPAAASASSLRPGSSTPRATPS